MKRTRYTRSELVVLYVLAVIFAGIHLLDIVTTMVFMSLGGLEGNHIPALIFNMLGVVDGAILLTMACVPFFMLSSFISLRSGRKNPILKYGAHFVVFIMIMVKIAIVFNNVVLTWAYFTYLLS